MLRLFFFHVSPPAGDPPGSRISLVASSLTMGRCEEGVKSWRSPVACKAVLAHAAAFRTQSAALQIRS